MADKFTAKASLNIRHKGRRFAEASIKYHGMTRKQVLDLEETLVGGLLAKAKKLAKG